MNLRTPRRRISPRTKHRYRVIRNFIRKALGSTSESQIKIGSSIAINVTDLKRKIIGLEQQLSEVSKHCQELASLDSLSVEKSNATLPVEQKQNFEIRKSQTNRSSQDKFAETDTEILYKPPEIQFDTCSYREAHSDNGDKALKFNTENIIKNGVKIKKKKSKLSDCTHNLHKRKTASAYEHLAFSCSTNSIHTVIDSRMAHCFDGGDNYNIQKSHKPFTESRFGVAAISKNHVGRNRTKTTNNGTKTRKSKQNNARQLDQDFIADIIKRQYKPVKMFGRRKSDISQFSAPVCRDQEYSVRDEILRDPELCSCCFNGCPNKVKNYHDLNEMRSVCDARLYSARTHSQPSHRKRYFETYNDSDLYDLIPVKEKATPKSRRKFVEDTIMAYDYYREVPPSPRTLRPRLNLKTKHYAEFEDFMARKHLSRRPKNTTERREDFENDGSYQGDEAGNVLKEIHQKNKQVQRQQRPLQENITIQSLQGPLFSDVQHGTGNETLNKTQDTDLSIDKTDKALCEIKDILQNFLQEIKKEATASQCDKSDFTSKAAEAGVNHQNMSANIIPNSAQNFNNYSMPHCGVTSFMPSFTNPCCYPLLPVCPMSCVQNGYAVPNPSLTCAKCANNKDTNDEKPTTTHKNASDICTTETDELIKKIYKYVAQSPRDKTEKYACVFKQKDAKTLTSRSVGGSNKVFKHDAKVGTPTMKCYSKSCEAIGSRIVPDTYYSSTNPTYSDTILEKNSLEATQSDSVSETDFSADRTTGEKVRHSRFIKVLRSFGIKKKKDVIEELSESDSTIEVEVKSKPPPFRQEVTNYMMNNQEYYYPPPVPTRQSYQECSHEYQAPYHPGIHHRPVQEIFNPHLVHQQTVNDHKNRHYHQLPCPIAPPYSQSFESYIPPAQNVPLCLKEVEVKSIGIQSERKMSFFKKMQTKIQVPLQSARYQENQQKNCSTQTAQNKAGLFNWKNLENNNRKDTNPMTFSYLKQKQLAEGDFKMRNAMLKKLFYKRNPFSPRNLIVRTLMGKDKSSFGEAPTMYRPKMFL